MIATACVVAAAFIHTYISNSHNFNFYITKIKINPISNNTRLKAEIGKRLCNVN